MLAYGLALTNATISLASNSTVQLELRVSDVPVNVLRIEAYVLTSVDMRTPPLVLGDFNPNVSLVQHLAFADELAFVSASLSTSDGAHAQLDAPELLVSSLTASLGSVPPGLNDSAWSVRVLALALHESLKLANYRGS